MTAPPLLSITDARLGFGGRPLFEGVSASIGEGDRIALVGRNGSGKSTLLKALAALVALDSGERFAQPGAKIAYLPQDPDLSDYATLGDYAIGALDVAERYKAEIAMAELDLRADTPVSGASGGEKRRAALARMLADEPDLMLLDEPTNHLDITAIGWLEQTLKDSRTGFVLISHDRAFLSALTRATLWLDRGVARRLDRGFAAFEEWRDKTFDEEDAQARKLDAKIRREEHWIVHGVSGRRKRNVRRVAELEALKDARRTATRRPDAAAMAFESGQRAGKVAIEVEGVSKRFGARSIVENFSLKIDRRDRVALVGPNGVGKTTLVRLLTGQLEPDSGRVKLGANLEMAVFDQSRSDLDDNRSLWENLTEDKALGVQGANDQVMVRGKPKHVVGYLKEFLFSDAQARQPVSALSGGERARLLLAKIMARTSNLLVLDEPTNDLDIETLDLLQETLDDYDGAMILVSHDRDFIDRVAFKTIALEGDGRATVYAGGYTDYRAQKAAATPSGEQPTAAATPKAAPTTAPTKAVEVKKLSFNDQRRLDALPGEIAGYEDDIAKLEIVLAQPDLYQKAPAKFAQATKLMADRRAKLEAAEEEWLALEERRDALGANS